MSIFQACVRVSLLFVALVTLQSFGQTTTGTLTGQWDFNQGDLKATVGADLQYLGGTAAITSFMTVPVNGTNGNVMQFPAADPTQGYVMLHGAQPNGGGTNVNVYTLVMDLLWPSGSDGVFRALFNTDTNNAQDATMFVNPDDAVGVNNQYSGQMLPDTWYRLALVFDLPNSTITKYLNGDQVGSQRLDDNVIDSQFSLGPTVLLFTDNDGDTASGQVNKIQFYSDALTADQIKALGIPVGDGAPSGNPGGDVKIESIQKQGTDVVITVSGDGNLQLEHEATLNNQWIPVGQPTTTGTFTVPATDPTAFFRVHKL